MERAKVIVDKLGIPQVICFLLIPKRFCMGFFPWKACWHRRISGVKGSCAIWLCSAQSLVGTGTGLRCPFPTEDRPCAFAWLAVTVSVTSDSVIRPASSPVTHSVCSDHARG